MVEYVGLKHLNTHSVNSKISLTFSPSAAEVGYHFNSSRLRVDFKLCTRYLKVCLHVSVISITIGRKKQDSYTHMYLLLIHYCFHFIIVLILANKTYFISYQMICKTTRLNKYCSHFTVDPLCKIPSALHLHTPSISFPHFLSFICTQFCISFTHFYHTVKLVLGSNSDKTKVLRTNRSLMQVERFAECSLGAFCNTFDLH